MPEPVALTHARTVVGAGGTAAGDTTVSGASFTLPADGPYTIHHIYAQVVAATLTAAEQVGGTIRMEAVQGDLDPNPAPTKFPTPVAGSRLGSTGDVQQCPLTLHRTRYTAPGKSTINLIYNQPIAVSVAPQIVAGIIFSVGDLVPEDLPKVFVDEVNTTVTSASDTSVGTITLAEKAKRITHVCGRLCQDGVLTTAEELIGFFRLQSDDVKLEPAQFPFSSAFSAGLGALINNTPYQMPVWIPVDIPLDNAGGARINCFVDLNTAVTNGAYVSVAIAYEQ